MRGIVENFPVQPAGFKVLNKLTFSTALVISGGHSPAAYDFVRALGKAGVRVAVASSQHDDMAFFSRYCGERIVLPEFEKEQFAAIAGILMRRYAAAPEPPVLYYTSDPELAFVMKYRDLLRQRFRFLAPENALLDALANKVLFNDLALEYDLPVPYTRTIPSGKDIRDILDQIDFPCIVKPAFSHDWIWDTEEQQEKFGPYKKALRRFGNAKDLIDFCEALPERQTGILIQSYIDGRDEDIVSFHGYFDEHSRCLGYFIGRKIRTYPMHTGGSAYIHTECNERLARLSADYFQRIHFKGIAKIDYKWDKRRNQFMILEINPRYNLWQLLGAYAGVNLAYIAYRHQRGETAPQQRRYAANARLLYFKQDLRAFFGGYRKTGEWTIAGYLSSILRPSFYRVFDPVDPAPFVRSSTDFVNRNFRKLLAKLSGKHLPASHPTPVTGGTAVVQIPLHPDNFKESVPS